jgi:hypothetical protein
MRRRRTLWLVLAAVLFGLASWLMWRGESGTRPLPPRHAEKDFPRYSRPEEAKREARRVVPVPFSSAEVAKPPAPRDPLLAALPPGARTAVVLEAAAIRDSPLGRLFLRCAFRDGGDRLEELKTKHGFDPVNSIDRVAMSEDAEIVTGAFGGVDWAGMFGGEGGATSRAYGSSGTIYDTGSDGGFAPALATWGDGMLLMGPNADALQRAIDRVEGRGTAAPPPISPGDAYGEAYGVLSADSLAGMLPDDLDAKLRATAQHIGLHVDARDEHDVLMVADVDGPDGPGVDDLGRSLGAAMAVGRVKARAEGDEDMRELLGVSRIVPHDGTFRVEVALPLDLLERKMCPDAGARR